MKLIWIASLLFTSKAFASPPSVHIKNFNTSPFYVELTFKNIDLQKGTLLSLAPDCHIEVTSVFQGTATATSDLCENPNRIQKGAALQPLNDHVESTLHSQQQKLKTPHYDKSKIQKGLLLSLVHSSLESQRLTTPPSGKFRTIQVEDHSGGLGFALGHSQINLFKPGYLARIVYAPLNNQSSFFRLETNASWGFHRRLFIYGGFNFQKISGHEKDLLLRKADLGYGYQVGVGTQVSRLLSLQLGYISTAHDNARDQLQQDNDFLLRGFELSLSATF